MELEGNTRSARNDIRQSRHSQINGFQIGNEIFRHLYSYEGHFKQKFERFLRVIELMLQPSSPHYDNGEPCFSSD